MPIFRSQIKSQAGLAFTTISISGNTNLTATNSIVLCDASTSFGGPVGIYLPPASSCLGTLIYFKLLDGSENGMEILPISGDNIDGEASLMVTTQYQVIGIASNGVNTWNLLSTTSGSVPTLQQVTAAGATTTANTTFGGNVNWGGTSGASYFDSNGNLHVRSGEAFAIISDDFGRAFLGMSIGDASLELANLTSQTVYSSSNLTLEAWEKVYLYSYNSPIVVGAQSTSLTGGAIDMALPTYFRSTLEFGTGGYIQDDGSGGVTISDAYSCTVNMNSNVNGFTVGCNVACPAVSCNTVYFPTGGRITDDGSGGVTITTASGYTLNCNNNGYIYWNSNPIDGGE
jgi:hypothetical protein